MNTTSVLNHLALSRLKLFWALSRMSHGFLDMATPALAAFLCLGSMPSARVILLGFLTAFAGYTAVYALNDVVDYRVDKEKMQMGGLKNPGQDLDAVYVRHPMAQGLLSFKEGAGWAAAWALVALIGAYLLNPVCALIFLVGCLLEVIYCLMLRVSYWRTFISGIVKTLGALAAVFAVEPNPSAVFLVVLFLWLFFWEIGGQNVPNDWTDLDEDRAISAKTIPVRFGLERSLKIILLSLTAAVVLSIVLFWAMPVNFGPTYPVGAILSGIILLLLPAWRLYTSRDLPSASALFNSASYYPLSILIVALVGSLF